MKLKKILENQNTPLSFSFTTAGGMYPSFWELNFDPINPDSQFSFEAQLLTQAYDAGDKGIELDTLSYEKDNKVQNLVQAGYIELEGDKVFITPRGKTYYESFHTNSNVPLGNVYFIAKTAGGRKL